jgi:nitrate/nitrite transporter NarK
MGPKLLIAVGEAASSTAELQFVRAVVGAAGEVFVVAPTMRS